MLNAVGVLNDVGGAPKEHVGHVEPDGDSADWEVDSDASSQDMWALGMPLGTVIDSH
eukprot:COSAG02_NODE_7422_length_3023_cov_2.812244_1_plen_57_part_00